MNGTVVPPLINVSRNIYITILKINIANGYKVITDGRPSKMPLKTVCKNCNRNIKYIVVRDEDYEKTLAFVQQK